MTYSWKAALAALLLTVTAVPAALAQNLAQCLPHKDAVVKLDRTYGERQIGFGLSQHGESVVELFVSESGTWTVLITRTDGLSCIAAAGDNWMAGTQLVDDPV
jgi:hypothetical protein